MGVHGGCTWGALDGCTWRALDGCASIFSNIIVMTFYTVLNHYRISTESLVPFLFTPLLPSNPI